MYLVIVKYCVENVQYGTLIVTT